MDYFELLIIIILVSISFVFGLRQGKRNYLDQDLFSLP